MRMTSKNARYGFLAVLLLWNLLFSLGHAGSVPVVVSIDELKDQITTFTGEPNNYIFGGNVLSLGDINGDGFDDIAFFSESTTPGEVNVCYIFLGREILPQSVDMAAWRDWGIRLRAPYGERMPLPVKGIGDLNHDGYDDVAFRSCRPLTAGIECPAYILFGGEDLPNDIDTSRFEGCWGCEIHLDANAIHEGSMSLDYATGDINGDGLKDLIVSEYRAYHEGMVEDAGMVYVIFGTDPFPESIQLTEIGTTHPGFIMYSTSPSNTFGFGNKVCADSDFNGDGIEDLVVGSCQWDRVDTLPGEHEGAVFVVFGRNDWPAEFVVDANQEGVCHIVGLYHFEHISRDMLKAEFDLNGDAVPDILCSGEKCMYLVSGSDLSPGRFLMNEIMTTRLEYERMFWGIGMENWNGDEIGDMAFGSHCFDSASPDIQAPGSVFILPGRSAYPETSKIGSEGLPRLQITGATTNFFFGSQLCSADVNGDGLSDMVTSAYFELAFVSDPPEGSPPGSVFIIPGGTDLKSVFRCIDFSPKRSTLAGGADLRITGAGFDENTRVYMGDKQIDILAMEDSRTIMAKIPEAHEPALLPVRIERGDESLVFEKQFEYYDSIFPRGLDVLELGHRGCTVFEPDWEGTYLSFQTSWHLFEGGGDFNGDGLGDILMPRRACSVDSKPQYKDLHEVFLLYGSDNLPDTILASELPEWGTVFTGDREVCEFFGHNAILAGDMNGDGASELAIWASGAGKVFIIMSGFMEKGEMSVYDLVDTDRCCLIENVPINEGESCSVSNRLLVKCGDINGDGLADLTLNVICTLGHDDRPKGMFAFVLGRKVMPTSISFDRLPKFYGKPAEISGGMSSAEGVGDVDGDGFEDIVFRSFDRAVNDGLPWRGIYFGREEFSEATFYEEELLTQGLCEIYFHVNDISSTISGIGDQNGDKIDDLAFYSIPKPSFSPIYYVPKQAKLRILYGGSRDKFNELRSITSDDDFDLTFTNEAHEYGKIEKIEGGRDVNYDGFPDILIADRHGIYQETPPPSRAVAIFGGNLEEKEGPLSELADTFDLVNYRIEPGESGNQFPTRIDFAGDVNGDGYEDLVMNDSSRFYIYYNPLGSTVYKDFIRGDTNLDGRIDIADAITVLQHLYSNNARLNCFDAGDANDDEKLDLADPIYILTHLFAEGAPPPPPNECGRDPFGTLLDCRKSGCP